MLAGPCTVRTIALMAGFLALMSTKVYAAPHSAAPHSMGDAQAAPPRRYLPIATLRHTYFGQLRVASDANASAVTTTTQLIELKVQAGHFFKRTGTVLAGSIAHDLLLLGSDATGTSGSTKPLHHLSLRLALAQRVHPKWMLSIFGKPGVASDYRGFHSRDLQLSAGVAARFAYRKDLVFVFGALYNNGVFGHLVLPILHIRYRWRWLRLLIGLPHRVALWVVPHRKMELGFVGRFSAGVFGIHDPSDRRALGDRFSSLFITAGLSVRSYLVRGWYLSMEGGYLVRYLRLFSSGRQTHGRLDFRGGYVSVATGYML